MSEKEENAALVPKPTTGDVAHTLAKAALSSVPGVGGAAAELFEFLLAPPLSKRRDEWMQSIAERLNAVETNLETLRGDAAFVTTMVQATQIAIRNHQGEKLEALRNAVTNSAIRRAPDDDVRAMFLSLVDAFTPTHLRILKFFQNRSSIEPTVLQQFRDQRGVTDQIVIELASRGLVGDPRPYVARSRDSSEALVTLDWKLTKLGHEFVDFISASRNC
jgi:hypothetical protein